MQYIKKGEYNSFTISVLDCNGNPFNFENYLVKFCVKKEKTDPDSAYLLYREMDEPDTHNLMFDFKAEETANLTEGKCFIAIKAYNKDPTTGVNLELWNDNCQIVKGVFND